MDLDQIYLSQNSCINGDLKIVLQKTVKKGVSVMAVKPITKGTVIAYYKLKIFKAENYKSPTNKIYSMTVYNRKGKEQNRFIGDIDKDCFPEPINGISFWGPFINEASPEQSYNAEIDVNCDLITKKKIKVGNYFIYNITATRYISAGEEITMYYGDDYQRSYEINPHV